MLTVTDAAARHLAHLLEQREVAEDQTFRLLLDGQLAGMETDRPEPADVQFMYLGRLVLKINQAGDRGGRERPHARRSIRSWLQQGVF